MQKPARQRVFSAAGVLQDVINRLKFGKHEGLIASLPILVPQCSHGRWPNLTDAAKNSPFSVDLTFGEMMPWICTIFGILLRWLNGCISRKLRSSFMFHSLD
jgi:hypothetical protein